MAAAEMAAAPVVEAAPRCAGRVSPGVSEGFLVELRDLIGHGPGDRELLLAVGEPATAACGRVQGVGEQCLLHELGALRGAAHVVGLTARRTP